MLLRKVVSFNLTCRKHFIQMQDCPMPSAHTQAQLMHLFKMASVHDDFDSMPKNGNILSHV